MYIVVSNCLNESHVNKLYSFIHSFIDPAHVINFTLPKVITSGQRDNQAL